MLAAHGHRFLNGGGAVAPDGQPGSPRWVVQAQIIHRHAQFDRAADNAKAWRLDHPQPSIHLARAAGQQKVEGRIQRRGGGHVMHLAIAEGEHPGEAGARGLGQSAFQRGEEPSALIAALGHRHHAQFEIVEPAEPGLQHAARGLHRGGAAGDKLRAVRGIDHQKGDIGAYLAGFFHQPGIGQRQEESSESRGAPPDAARPAQKGRQQRQRRKPGRCRQQPERDDRREIERGELLHHWPSRSRMAGTCTWSPL